MIIHFGLGFFFFFFWGSFPFPCIHYIRSCWVPSFPNFVLGFLCSCRGPCDEFSLVAPQSGGLRCKEQIFIYRVGTQSTCMHVAHVAMEKSTSNNIFKLKDQSGILDILPLKGDLFWKCLFENMDSVIFYAMDT